VSVSCDALEGRVTPAHFGHHAIVHASLAASLSSGSTSSTSGSSSSSSLNTALTQALQTLRDAVQSIELASKTTVGELTAIRADFRALANDGLTLSSGSALSSFENSLVTAFATGGSSALLNSDGTPNSTQFDAFEALYTSSPSSLTTQQTTDLTAAYTALANAVISSNITSGDINTINTDWSAVLAARGSTSTTTYPYFSLVTGGNTAGGGGCGGGGF
jgi:hypothetical protein